MMQRLQFIIKFSFGFAIILGCLLGAKWIVMLSEIKLPAALLGMGLLVILLFLGVVKPEWIAPAANPILKYMALFFIPAGVGVVEHIDLFQSQWVMLALLLTIVPTLILTSLSPIVKRIKFRD
ncbi:CidA/LrgA family protein [Pseudoalteromonas sp. PS5]|nr:CidA/LrgA family protein [Pseudoalteromonas sp. PS5]